MGPELHSYSYPEALLGFAEVDLEEFDRVFVKADESSGDWNNLFNLIYESSRLNTPR